MTTYKGIKGFNIQTVSSDPSNPIVGQIWYNSTSSIVKYFASLPEAWSIGGNLSDKKTFMGGAGTQTAGLSIGGNPFSGGPKTNSTEEYNGTAWAAGGNLTTADAYMAGCGTQTAALSAGGGAVPAATFEYDGSSWTGGGNLNVGRQSLFGGGTQTAGLVFGGSPTGAPAGIAMVEI